MIKIRSTEKLATSNSNGLCDVLRELSSFSFDLKKNVVKTIVRDCLFKEQEVPFVDDQGDDQVYTERIILEVRKEALFSYKIEEIDSFFQAVGTDITMLSGFSTGLQDNLGVVLSMQTTLAERQTMTNWIVDTPHILVKEFSEITPAPR
tara:strand:- start:98 stop:544 length:447 start_codon:yes stop_codon:yes gene_type:complete